MFKNLQPPEEAVEAVVECVRGGDFHGYAPSAGRLTKCRYNNVQLLSSSIISAVTGHNVAKQAVATYCEDFYEGLTAKVSFLSIDLIFLRVLTYERLLCCGVVCCVVLCCLL